MFEALTTTSGIPQTRVTFASKVDIKGSVPSFVMNRLSTGYASNMIELRKKFHQSDKKFDKDALENLVNIIRNEHQHYTEEEEEAITKGKEFYLKCNTSKKFKDVKTPEQRVTMKFIYLEGETQGIGICEAVIDASLAECVTYEFIKDSREKQAKLGKKYKAIETKKLNGHSQLYLNRRSLGAQGLSEREWRTYCCWKKEEGDKFCWTVYKDTDLLNDDLPLSSGTVLASATTTWMFEALTTHGGIPQTRATFTSRVDIKGSVPSFVMNRLSTGYASSMIELRK
ncbi:hypothetical protein TrRE_jg5725, partial [Triparma retinervis]